MVFAYNLATATEYKFAEVSKMYIYSKNPTKTHQREKFVRRKCTKVSARVCTPLNLYPTLPYPSRPTPYSLWTNTQPQILPLQTDIVPLSGTILYPHPPLGTE